MMEDSSYLAPAIRFAGFTDPWEQRKLGDFYEFKNGLNKGKEFFGSGTPIVNYVDVYRNRSILSSMLQGRVALTQDEVARFEVRQGDIFFTRTSETIDEVGYSSVMLDQPKGAVFSGFVLRGRATSEDPLDNLFKRYVFFTDEFRREMTSKSSMTTRALTTGGALCNMEFSFPSDGREQHLIGEIFQQIDNLITLHQRRCDATKQLKKYMLQNLFPRKGAAKPEIRFSGFTDDWEQRKLGEVCERVTRKNKNGESDLPLTIASQYGLIDQRDFFNKVVAAKDMSNYYLLKKGEFAYNKSYSNGFDYGSIKRLNAYEQGCLSTLYICFGITSDDVESDYLECYFDTLKWYGDVSQICAEGARNHGLLNVDTKAFFDEVTIEMPSSKEEQKKISAYLNNLDNLITLHQRKCDSLKQLKAYMLQNMFV